ncbi:MAG: glycosyltransferase [Lachnospiraceae bacterium]|nr:glycosyltransferase [Lachnospiraceae bacterium]
MNESPDKYSVLMSLYWREKPEYLRESLDSIVAQTVMPDEIVIVKDGPLGDALENVLSEYSQKYPELFRFVNRPDNGGFGLALRDGVLACRNEWIARMDTDDIADVHRIEVQLDVIRKRPELDMVASVYYEFLGDLSHLVLRNSPESNDDLIKYMHKRNPFGHDTLMLRKSKILEAGNYESEVRFEDYSLWIRMVLNNAQMYNIQTPLLYVRGTKDYYSRRGGYHYMLQNISFFLKYRKKGFFTWKDCVISLIPRCMVCLMPNQIRTWVYEHFLRTKVMGGER